MYNLQNTSLIDHSLASILSRVSQHGVINVSVSDHQLIYCTFSYSNFFQKIRIVVDSIVPFKSKRVKVNTQKWFDGEFLQNINTKDKLFKKFKKSRLHNDKKLYKKAKYNTSKLIAAKNEHFLMKNS